MTVPFDIEEFKQEVVAEVTARLEAGRDERQLVSPRALAERLDVSERVAREMLGTGVIPSFKVGGLRRALPADVDRYIAAQQEGGGVCG